MPRRKKGERFLFTVEGTGIFPFDMLRYDACWPNSERYDTPGLAVGMYGESAKRRRVVLVTTSEHSPTPARWESFSWQFIGYGDCHDETKYPTLSRGEYHTAQWS